MAHDVVRGRYECRNVLATLGDRAESCAAGTGQSSERISRLSRCRLEIVDGSVSGNGYRRRLPRAESQMDRRFAPGNCRAQDALDRESEEAQNDFARSAS